MPYIFPTWKPLCSIHMCLRTNSHASCRHCWATGPTWMLATGVVRRRCTWPGDTSSTRYSICSCASRLTLSSRTTTDTRPSTSFQTTRSSSDRRSRPPCRSAIMYLSSAAIGSYYSKSVEAFACNLQGAVLVYLNFLTLCNHNPQYYLCFSVLFTIPLTICKYAVTPFGIIYCQH